MKITLKVISDLYMYISSWDTMEGIYKIQSNISLILHCVVPENILPPPAMEGLGNSEGEGGLIVKNFRREGGLGENHNFKRVFWAKYKGGLTRAAFWSIPTDCWVLWMEFEVITFTFSSTFLQIAAESPVAYTGDLKSPWNRS